MQGSGAASSGAAPESSDDLERARRSLYARDGASASAVAGYERMAARTRVGAPEDRDGGPGTDGPSASESVAVPLEVVPVARSRWSLRLRAGLVGGAVLAAVVVGAVVLSPRPLPERVPPPGLPGRLLLSYSRLSNPQSAPHAVTFEPTYYTAYQPRGRRVGVALRCIGSGTVRISAGPRFTFRCTDREAVLTRTSGPISTPFLILGRTTGNVVWGVRIVLLPAAASAGLP